MSAAGWRRRVEPAAGAQALAAWLRGPRDAAGATTATAATAVRYTLELIAQAAPGRSVELRVPPFGAVQCVPGPRHTRGTPPTVVETDALTWLTLATGGASWAQEVDAGRVRASGERSDLSPWLPVQGADAGTVEG